MASRCLRATGSSPPPLDLTVVSADFESNLPDRGRLLSWEKEEDEEEEKEEDEEEIHLIKPKHMVWGARKGPLIQHEEHPCCYSCPTSLNQHCVQGYRQRGALCHLTECPVMFVIRNF